MDLNKKEYKITKEVCQQMIDNNHGVCSDCGGKLEPLETVDNSGDHTYWSGCNTCMKFDWGTPPEVFQIASKMVREHHFQPYSHDRFPYDGTEIEKEQWYKSQIGGTCGTVRQILKLKEEITTHE